MQTFILLPFFFVMMLRKQIKFYHFLLVPAVYFISILPAFLMGRPLSELLTIYISQSSHYKHLTMNFPNFYIWISDDYYETVKYIGLCITFLATLIVGIVLSRKKIKFTFEHWIQLAFLSAVAVPFLLPGMHERYMYLGDVLGVLYFFIMRKNAGIPAGIIFVSFYSYIRCSRYEDVIPRAPAFFLYLFILMWFIFEFKSSFRRTDAIMPNSRKNFVFLFFTVVAYLFLFIYSFNFCYFWDTIQQVSKEAYWYYQTDFSSLLMHPVPGLDIMPTGYHPPLITIITAVLWKIFGYHLWISHAFTFFWAILLIYHAWKLISFFIPEEWRKWSFLILLLESTVITQFVIASPDFILLTACVIALRAIFERKPVWLAIGLIFLCGANMRGIFTGVLLFISHFHFDFHAVNHKKYNIKKFWKFILPYIPVLSFLLIYFIYYFANNKWFFADNDRYSEHYVLPENMAVTVKHLAALVMRFVENGRFIVWLLAIYWIIIILKKKIKLSGEEQMLGLFFVLITGLYFLFAFITKMPFSSRYFMVQFFVLSLLVLRFSANRLTSKKMKVVCLIILFYTLTGHCWIYPEKISQCWESTLLHTPYYKLRKECFDYIDKNHFNYSDLSAGFCLSGNRGYIELKNEGKIIGNSMNTKYFIYSNISNLEDEKVDELKNPQLWTPIKSFEKMAVYITIYEKNEKY
jgi:hypothetical protein